VIIALQAALALNLLLLITAHLSPVVSVLWIAAVFVGILAMYSLAASYALMLVIGSLLSITFIALQSFAVTWFKDALGLNALSDTQVYAILMILTATALVLVFLAERSKTLGFILDSSMLACFLVTAFKYFAFLYGQNWPQRPWIEELVVLQDDGVRNLTVLDTTLLEGGPAWFCCDDSEIPCPVWFDPADVLYVLLLAAARILYVWIADGREAYYARKERAEIAERARLKQLENQSERDPLLSRAIQQPHV
jgi:hypothetical protein